ncbi:efflux RND transporter periplasmic adaptor subunit [Jannaschia sp. W003]|uniref:efflux RND transporter periplasmic adaptor subunit n=1 Tax=Jannaschia sp. W003 TaxID=2867012 RepID=UPI0021A402B2|nr:efflux RND transporter periplasmic adaptor subunit [Jannaschia sp. W003]UWQ20143.1 efflux RND transporter periplasmic adaptor subunit [Jannaschia sp. W003]
MNHPIPSPRGASPRIAAAFGGALLALALFGGPAVADAPVVKLAPVTAGDGAIRRVFFGKVVARETVDLAFQVGGQIVELPVEEGAPVPEGALVARMDLAPFRLALDEAEARAEQARRTEERYRKLVGSAVAETNLEDAATEATLAEIARRDAERSLGNAELHAPFDGLVAARLVPNFSTVAAGTPVVRLHDMSDLRIEIDVPETLFQRAGQAADIGLTARFPASDRSFPLEIREFNAETAAVGQTYRLTLGMAPPEGLVVLPGASAEVSAELRTGGARIELPASAIVIANDRSTRAMVFEPAGAETGTVRAVPVTIAATDRGTVEVTDGLEPGQEVVAVGAGRLDDGAAVRRFTGFGE